MTAYSDGSSAFWPADDDRRRLELDREADRRDAAYEAFLDTVDYALADESLVAGLPEVRR